MLNDEKTLQSSKKATVNMLFAIDFVEQSAKKREHIIGDRHFYTATPQSSIRN
jgi:hypothetical protein